MARIKPIKVFREPPGRRKTGSDPLSTQPNLGPKSAAWLRAAGIHSLEEVRKLGIIETCRRVRALGYPVSVMFAYGLEGTLAGCHWNQIPAETKEWLRAEYTRMKQASASARSHRSAPG